MSRIRSKSQRQYFSQNDAGKMAAALEGAHGERMPKFIAPCLAMLRDKVPIGDQWLHEIKFDGYRLQLHKRENDIRFYTRRGHDWTERFSSLIQSAWYLPVTHLILDGEVIVPTESGHSDFGSLEDDLGTGRSDRFVYFVFDILHINGISLRDCALVDRKSVLTELLRGQNGPIRVSDHLQGGGEPLFKRACRLELEGLVSKRKVAKYHSGRSADWTKRTCRQRETFVVAGIAFNRGKFDGLYLSRRENGELLYAGKVENGFDKTAESEIRERAERLKTSIQPLSKKIKKPKATWLKPKLLVDVEYRALIASPFVHGHPRGSLNRPRAVGCRQKRFGTLLGSRRLVFKVSPGGKRSSQL